MNSGIHRIARRRGVEGVVLRVVILFSWLMAGARDGAVLHGVQPGGVARGSLLGFPFG
ncbi:hypothetical protein ACQQ2N_16130 [Dokdonella sp. MW10]|uniref:hypothetical protein n=1 Tax=Dokdonella sp. MW10 TaxID=2992926 RepID=UPI003F816321